MLQIQSVLNRSEKMVNKLRKYVERVVQSEPVRSDFFVVHKMYDMQRVSAERGGWWSVLTHGCLSTEENIPLLQKGESKTCRH